MKSKKTLLYMLLALVVLASVIFAAGCFHEETPKKLSSLSEKECRQFLLDRGITIPEVLEGIKLKELFADLEADPYMECDVVSWSVIYDFHNAVSTAVREYYGVPPKS